MDSVPVLWRHGRRTGLAVPAGEFAAAAQAVDNTGDVAGYCFGPAGNSAFLWRDGQVLALGTPPGSTGARALGINDNNQVVGNTDYDAFRWDDGQMTALPDLTSTSSAADINNLGQAIGSSATTAAGLNPHAVPWTGSASLTRPATVPGRAAQRRRPAGPAEPASPVQPPAAVTMARPRAQHCLASIRGHRRPLGRTAGRCTTAVDADVPVFSTGAADRGSG